MILLFSGCNLSPLLFSLFISNLGPQLNNKGFGIDLESLNIGAIFFADDIVVIGRSERALNDLMEITRRFFSTHHLELSEKKSKVIGHNAVTGQITFKGAADDFLTLEEVLSYKYLGIPVCSSPYNLFKKYNEQVKTRAKAYLASILSLVKTGPDRSELAFTLWSCCALPSILYGCEIMPLTQATISEIEKCQSQVGKFMLQIPRSSASVSVSIDAGLRPVWAHIAEKTLLYASSLMRKSEDFWPRIAMNVNLALGFKSPYTRHLLKWKSVTNSSLLSVKAVKKSVHDAAVHDVITQQQKHFTTTFAMNLPDAVYGTKWFKPKPWVSDSSRSKILSRFRACNASLGNRGPTKDGQYFPLCPLCAKKGDDALNNEVTFVSCWIGLLDKYLVHTSAINTQLS